MPGPKPDPTTIFHITPISSLRAIAKSGRLLSKNEIQRLGIVTASIAYESIQGRRAARKVPCGAGGTLHDYVPFHFGPRSPMLMAINGGHVPGCDYRQADIVHLVAEAQTVQKLGRPFVFSDVHAVFDYAEIFDDLEKLDEIEWSIFFEYPQQEGYCIYWQNRHTNPLHVRRKEIRQAEFLVHEYLPLAAIREIGVISEQAANLVRVVLAGTGWGPPIVGRRGWYY